MKYILSLSLLIGSFFSLAQEISIKVSGAIFNLDVKTVHISKFFGDRYQDFASTSMDKDGNFSFDTKLPSGDYYVLRLGEKKHLNLILRNNSDIKIYGDGEQISLHANIIGSEESKTMNEYLRMTNSWNFRRDLAINVIKDNPAKKDSITQVLNTEFKQFQSQQQTFIQRNSNSAALYPILPQIDTKRDFASYESIIQQLLKAFPESPTIQETKKIFDELKAQKIANDPLAEGKMAPDFEEKMLDGGTLKLSDLRGKVVLLDFWASWCRPCRAANPDVVKAYEKYGPDGFTVLSVSLDSKRPNWEAAIAQDNLTWPNHVSALKGWDSVAKSLYQVSGIPFTVLIDKDGKIIAKGNKIRNAGLEKELHRIFGH